MRIHKLYLFGILIFFLFASHLTSYAQPRFSGGITNYNGVQLNPPHEFLIGYNNFKLIMEQRVSDGRFYLDVDAEHHYTAAFDSLRFMPREIWAELYFDNSDLRIGRQLMNWSVAEGSEVWNQINPQDLSRVVTTEPEKLQLGTDALRWVYFSGNTRIEGIINPVFMPNTIPEPDSRWFPDIPIPGDLDTEYQGGPPRPDLSRIQYGLRLQLRNLQNVDFDLKALYWHNSTPAYFKEAEYDTDDPGTFDLPDRIIMTETYLQTPILGFSTEYRPVPNWYVFAESAWHAERSFDYLPQEIEILDQESVTIGELNELRDALEEEEQNGFLRQLPYVNSSIGVRYQSGSRAAQVTAGNESIFNYEDEIAQEQYFWSITGAFTDTYFRDRLALQIAGRYHITGNDFWLTPSLSYDLSDYWEITAGTHLFGGSKPDQYYGHLSFQQYSGSTVGYLKLQFRW